MICPWGQKVGPSLEALACAKGGGGLGRWASGWMIDCPFPTQTRHWLCHDTISGTWLVGPGAGMAERWSHGGPGGVQGARVALPVACHHNKCPRDRDTAQSPVCLQLQPRALELQVLTMFAERMNDE